MMREWMSCLVVSGVRNVRILVMLRRWSLHVAEVESACCGGGVCMLRRRSLHVAEAESACCGGG
ncbi:unnamed protein product, partial [Staurois parvus]